MTFLHPWVLLLLLPVGVAAAWNWLRRGRHVTFPFDAVRPPRREVLGLLLRVAGLLPFVAAGWAVVLLAAPQKPKNAPDDRPARHVHFLLDSSTSMLGVFGPATRSDAALNAIEQFVTHRKNDAFALTLYSDLAVNWIPLTQDVQQFVAARPFIHPRVLPGPLSGGTATGLALNTVCDQFALAPPGERVLILVTDGIAGDLDEAATETIGTRLRGIGVTVYTILVDMDRVPPSASRVSDLTGGRLFTAGDPRALADVFTRIDRLSEVVSRRTTVVLEDDFRTVAVILVVALTLHSLALMGLRTTPW